MSAFDDTMKHYGAALRWAHESSAAAFVRHRDEEAESPVAVVFDPNIRVTDYDIKSIAFSADNTEAIVTAKLSYFATDAGIVRVVTDRQVWWYDPEAERWFLDGDIPEVLQKNE
jgi:hypothetical protein